MLEPCALARDLGRQRGVIDDRDLGAVEHFRQLIRGHVRIAMNAHRGITGFCQSFENNRKRLIGIDEYTTHRILHWVGQDATPASASTVCISTLAPAVQSACVASSSSLWLTPSLQGTNTIAAGMMVLRLQASWPAPEVMRRCE